MNFSRSQIKKILIFRFGAIGDVVHSSALFRAIKKFNSELKIDYLTTAVPAALIKNDPDLNKVIILENKSYKYLVKLASELRKEEYDLCINLQPSIRTRFFSCLIKAERTLVYKKSFKLHAVENFWQTALPLFKNIKPEDNLSLFLPCEAKEKILSQIDKKFVVFNMGVSPTRQGRRWETDNWMTIGRHILDNYDYDIYLTGSAEDAELSEKLLELSDRVKSYCGKLDILENTALVSHAKLVISGDTGPLHIATALNIPTISFYGAAPYSRTGPYGKNSCNFIIDKPFSCSNPLHIAVSSSRECVPCNRRKCKYISKNDLYTPCLQDITPGIVIELMERFIL